MGGKVYVAWKRKMLYDVTLHDVVGGHLSGTKHQPRPLGFSPTRPTERERERNMLIISSSVIEY